MLFIVPFRHRYSSRLEGAACWWPWTTILITNMYRNSISPLITPFYSCLPTAALLAPFCHLRPSLGFSSSFTFFPVSSFLYPTPVLSPWWVLFDLAPSFLNHVEIFGWFFVISSPLLLSSFFFFAAAAFRSPHYFFFISKFACPIAFIRFWASLSPFVSLSCPPMSDIVFSCPEQLNR